MERAHTRPDLVQQKLPYLVVAQLVEARCQHAGDQQSGGKALHGIA
jgi:hypothetical protein